MTPKYLFLNLNERQCDSFLLHLQRQSCWSPGIQSQVPFLYSLMESSMTGLVVEERERWSASEWLYSWNLMLIFIFVWVQKKTWSAVEVSLTTASLKPLCIIFFCVIVVVCKKWDNASEDWYSLCAAFSPSSQWVRLSMKVHCCLWSVFLILPIGVGRNSDIWGFKVNRSSGSSQCKR